MAKLLAGKSLLAASLISFAACSSFAQATGGKAEVNGAQSQVAGVWRGNSVCSIKDSPCHDEVNVYRFSEIAGKPELFSVTASKIVDGKEIVMGPAGEWKYDAETHTLEANGGLFRFIVDGNRMEGSISLRDNTVYRRVHLVRQADPSPK